MTNERLLELLDYAVQHIEDFEEDESENVLEDLGFTEDELKEIRWGVSLDEKDRENISMVRGRVIYHDEVIFELSEEGNEFIFFDQKEDENSPSGWICENVPFKKYHHYFYTGSLGGDPLYTGYAWYSPSDHFIETFQTLEECLDWLAPKKELINEVSKTDLVQEDKKNKLWVYNLSVVDSEGFMNGKDSSLHSFSSREECVEKAYELYVKKWEALSSDELLTLTKDGKYVDSNYNSCLSKDDFAYEFIKEGYAFIQLVDSHIKFEFTQQQIELPKEVLKALNPVEETIGDSSSKNKVSIETPLGDIVVTVKTDSGYPGVYVDLKGDKVNDTFEVNTAPLATVEYNPNIKNVQSVVYGDANSEEPSHIVSHSNLKKSLSLDEMIGAVKSNCMKNEGITEITKEQASLIGDYMDPYGKNKSPRLSESGFSFLNESGKYYMKNTYDNEVRYTGFNYSADYEGFCEDFDSFDECKAWLHHEFEISDIETWRKNKKEKELEL